MSRPEILILAGPTACGKTDVAHALLACFPVEMISCDSMQVYRSMSVLTQAPVRRKGRGPVTHLVSFLSPQKEYNASLFRRDAVKLIDRIIQKKKTPLLVGGTGLYLRALLDGLFEADGQELVRDENFRKRLAEEHEKLGAGALHERLRQIDASSAEKIHPNDIRRVIRALEVHHLTGRTLSSLKANRRGLRDDFHVGFFFLDRDREDLYDRINRRVERMWRGGVVEEVRKLLKRKPSLTARMALGVREAGAYLKGELSKKEAIELLKQNTRNYAKRQLSWFRHEKGITPIQVSKDETASATARKVLEVWEKR